MTKKIALALAVILLLGITFSAFPITGRAAAPTREELDSLFTSVGYTSMYSEAYFTPEVTVPDEFVYHYLLMDDCLSEYLNEETGLYQLSYADFITAADRHFFNHSDMIAFLSDPARTYFDPVSGTEKSIYDPETQSLTLSFSGGAGGMFGWELTNVYTTSDRYILQGIFVNGEAEIPEDARPGFDYILDENEQKLRIETCLQLTLENAGDYLQISGYEKIDRYYSPADNYMYVGSDGAITERYRTVTVDSGFGTLTLQNEPTYFPLDTTAWYVDAETELVFTASAEEGVNITGITVTDSAGEHSLELTEDGSYTFLCGTGHVTIVLTTDADIPSGGPDDSSDPTDPSGDPTDPSGDPTDPSGDPTDPSGDPSDPTGDPTEPSGDPTEPTGDPTEPTGSPTEPSTEPTLTPPSYDLNTDPTEPTPAPTEPPTTAPVTPTFPVAADSAIQDPATNVVISFPVEYSDIFRDLTLSVVIPDLETEEQVMEALLKVLDNNPAVSVFDIRLLDSEGAVAAPGVTMQVMLPIPENWSAQNLQIFHVDVQTGKVTKLSTAITEDGKWACFSTNHFSYYVLAQDPQIRTNTVDAFVFVAAGLLAASAVALVAILILNAKSKKGATRK